MFRDLRNISWRRALRQVIVIQTVNRGKSVRMTNNSNIPPPSRRVDLQREIASRLRMLYAEVEQEPIPASLIDLLEQLDEAEAADVRNDR